MSRPLGQDAGDGTPHAGAKRISVAGTGALVTKSLIAVNVLVFLVNLAQGATLSQNGGSLFEKGALVMRGIDQSGQVVGLAEGEWWRLITAAFLHGGLFHLGMNMLVLWWVGAPMEAVIGRGRFLGIYIVSGLAGLAGALIVSPNAITVGASGAIFGVTRAALVFETQRTYVLGRKRPLDHRPEPRHHVRVPRPDLGRRARGRTGRRRPSRPWRSPVGRAHAAYGRPGLIGVLGIVAVGVASVVVAYVQVQSYS